jgi:hypothetical protein
LRFAVTGLFVTALHALVAVLFINFVARIRRWPTVWHSLWRRWCPT